MKRIALIGCGHIGSTIAELLLATGDYRVTLLDASRDKLGRLAEHDALTTHCLDVSDEDAVAAAVEDHVALLCAGPYTLGPGLARLACRLGLHYLDLTEDRAATREVTALAENAKTALIPQCGLAPGFISIVANWLGGFFEELDTIQLRVGALPRYPTNSLKYNLTWSTAGLVNEYCEPCEIIMNGERMTMPPLTQRKEFSLDGNRYESFNTSGGLGSLARTLAGRVRNLGYQTIRYPGHLDIVRTLLQDLRLSERRHLLCDILEYSIPATCEDVVLIFANASGRKNGQLQQRTYVHRVYGQPDAQPPRSAIQITTASAACAMLDLLCQGRLPDRGLIRQEQVPLETFLDNRFGQCYASESALVKRTPEVI